MSDTTQLIKDRLDIADFIKQYVTLSPAGKNLKGLCPFHKEKTPSFIVSPERQIWHCFGACAEGGDIIKFLMKHENIEFIEALKILAEKAGVELQRGASDQRQYEVLYEINKVAKEFFRTQLESDSAVAKSAYQYLIERGLKPETIHEFEIGFAPNSSDALSRHLSKTGFKIQDIERAGLVFKTERGTYWDRFRNRIMFPLLNHFGKCVGFTGRLTPGSEETAAGKYVNSPETPIFMKSRLLFGFDKSKNAIREDKTAVLVEGQMDFISAWQDGIKNLIATSGTALTREHLKAVKRSADTLVIAFDNDEAGQLATERAIDLGNESDFNVKVINHQAIHEKNLKDPADIVKAEPGLMAKFVRDAEPAMQYYFKRYLSGGELRPGLSGFRDIANLKKNIRIVLAKIKAIASPVERAHWLNQLSALTSISEQHLLDEMAGLSASALQFQEKDSQADKPKISEENFPRKDLIAQRFIGLSLSDSHFKEKAKESLRFLAEPYNRIGKFLLYGEKIELSPEFRELADFIALRSSLELGGEVQPVNEFRDLERNLKLEYYKDRREILGVKIREAEQKGDERGLVSHLREFDRISKEMANI